MNISRRADQTVDFEVEIQNLQLCQGPTRSNVVLAKSIQTRNGKPAFSLVTDGAGGSNTVYIKVVSAPTTTQMDVLDYFETIRRICSIGKKNNGTSLQDYFNPMFALQYTQEANRYKLTFPSAKILPGNSHINLAVPFNAIGSSKIARTKLFANEKKDNNPALCPFSAAQEYAQKYKTTFGASETLVSLLTLFFYQQIVLINAKNFIIPYTTNTRPAENLSKTIFPVLFKVSKADIIKKVLSDAERSKLGDNKLLEKIQADLSNIATRVGTVSVPPGYTQKATEVLSVNATTPVTLFDEPLPSGVIAPYPMAAGAGYYVVAEARQTQLNDRMKQALCDPLKATPQDFLRELQSFFAET